MFHNIGGKRNAGQFRIDFTNFGNLLNHNWGVSQRFVVPMTQANGAQILTNAGVDAQGRASYRMAVANDQLVTKSFQTDRPSADRRVSVHAELPVYVQLVGELVAGSCLVQFCAVEGRCESAGPCFSTPDPQCYP